jgi:peptide/nickel transport system permease protein
MRLRRPDYELGTAKEVRGVGLYVLKRLATLIVVVFLVSVGTFFLVHLLPGDPTVTILGPNDTAQNKALLLKQLGLNQPLLQQYFTYVGHILQGDLGESFITHQTVTNAIANAVPIDIELIVFSQIMAFGVSIPLALLAARRPNKALDKVSTGATFGLLALPPFIVIVILTLIFSVHLHLLPGPSSYVPITQDFWQNIRSMLLPSITLALGSIVIYYRLLRNDLIATLQEDFITMARSKGLSDRRVLVRHALRPSSLSLLASAGTNIGSLIAGAFVVEYLLALPGLGYLLVQSIQERDYLMVQGVVLFVAVAILVINFIVDSLFSVVDPRIARD